MTMFDTAQARSSTRPAGFAMSLVPLRTEAAFAPATGLSFDAQYSTMDRAYARRGGWTSGDDVARLLRRRFEQPVSTLARWIVARRIVSFDCHGQTLVPLFQFDLADMSPRPGVLEVVAQLTDTLDDLALALWFATANAWLDGETPVDAIATDQAAVSRAALACRLALLE